MSFNKGFITLKGNLSSVQIENLTHTQEKNCIHWLETCYAWDISITMFTLIIRLNITKKQSIPY